MARKIRNDTTFKEENRGIVKGKSTKIQLISAILHNPEFIILDEPFSGLDPVNAEMLKMLCLS